MKYIMIQGEIGKSGVKQKIPIIFPNNIVHCEIANNILQLLEDRYLNNCTIISAGDYNPETAETTGNSSTLKLDADSSDGKIILMYDYFHGIN